jgi:hypothetical protein
MNPNLILLVVLSIVLLLCGLSLILTARFSSNSHFYTKMGLITFLSGLGVVILSLIAYG